MKKSEQIEINNKVVAIYDYHRGSDSFLNSVSKRLRNCQAEVFTSNSGFWLKSYNTTIAYIPYNEGVCYDFLRYVYGYTATSAQHISKFAHDYGNGTILSWKAV